jgi:glycosyltransferase involved in cell wall biosynthesis
MKFTFVTPADNLGGGTRVIATYARLLAARGHEVLVVANAPDRPGLREQWRALRRGQWRAQKRQMLPQPGHIAHAGVPLHTLEKPRPVCAEDLPDADVLIATWWETAEWIHPMPASKGFKVHLIQGYEVWPGPHGAQRVHAALRLPNFKIVISEELKKTLQTRLGALDVSLVPNSVDFLQFNASARLPHLEPVVGFMYGQSFMKAPDLYCKACTLARQQMPNLRFVAFGADLPGPEFPLPEGTTFFHRPDQGRLASIYASCDAWLFGSRIDSFGLPILEAMACHTPVIAVPVGAAPALLADGCGVLIAPEHPQAMADAILQVLRMPAADWQCMSERAYQKAHAYSWDDAADLFLATIVQSLAHTAKQ